MFTRFSARLFLTVAAAVGLTVAVIAAFLLASVRSDAEEQFERELLAVTAVLRPLAEAELVRNNDGFAALQVNVQELARETGLRLTVVMPSGLVVAESSANPASLGNHAGRAEVVAAARSAEGVGRAIRRSDSVQVEMLYVARRVGPASLNGGMGHGVVRAAVPYEQVDALADSARDRVLWGSAVGMGLALLLAWVGTRSLMRPVRRLTDAALTEAGGPLPDTGETGAGDEIDQLARAMERMEGSLSARAKRAQELRERDLAILASMRDGVIAVNHSQEIVHINRAAESLLRLPHGSANGRLLHEVIRVPGILNAIQGAVDARDVPPTDFILHQGAGERVVELAGSTLLGPGGETIGAVVVLRDVTDLRKLESIRRDFVANVSHELKTPLTAIRSLTETLLEDDELPPDLRRRFLEKVAAQSARLSALVTDLLSLSRLEQGTNQSPYEVIDVVTSVTDTARLLAANAAAKRIDLRVEVPSDAIWVLADEESMRQLLSNLIDNAIKYTPEAGKVSISLKPEGTEAVVEVRDTGIGIESSQVDRIFERFYRVDKARSREVGGTGLGLSIVKHIVIALGGTIDVESVPGHGSAFIVRLPLASADAAASSRRLRAAEED